MLKTPAPPVMKLPFGRVLRSAEGTHFVFIGYRQNTVSTELWFAEEVCGKSMEPRTYNCTGLATLLRKFPELVAPCTPKEKRVRTRLQGAQNMRRRAAEKADELARRANMGEIFILADVGDAIRALPLEDTHA